MMSKGIRARVRVMDCDLELKLENFELGGYGLRLRFTIQGDDIELGLWVMI